MGLQTLGLQGLTELGLWKWQRGAAGCCRGLGLCQVPSCSQAVGTTGHLSLCLCPDLSQKQVWHGARPKNMLSLCYYRFSRRGAALDPTRTPLGMLPVGQLSESTNLSSNVAENHIEGSSRQQRRDASTIPTPFTHSYRAWGGHWFRTPSSFTLPCCIARNTNGGCQVSARKSFNFTSSPQMDNVSAH